MDDLAWTPGLSAWSPLVQVLYPGRTPVEETIEIHSEPPVVFPREQPVEAEAEAVPEEVPAGEPPTAKQKAFLNYMGIPFATGTTKEAAAILVSEAMEDPTLSARVLPWNDERLRLHPDIFAAEAQAKKEDRANRYFDICQHEGADILVDVTKAHCQVLVGYLDVNFPNWDAHEADAPRAYFFPAVAEKFPQCVRKEWRDKLKYPSGPRIAADFGKRSPSTRLHTGPSPLGALIRGAVFGLALLLVLYVGAQMLTGDPVAEAPDFTSAEPPPPPKIVRPPDPVKPAAPMEPELVKADAAPASPPAEPPAMDATPAIPAAPKTHVVIAKPVEVKLRFGSAKIPRGTQFKIIAQDAASVTVIYAAETVSIPIDHTDLAAPSSEQ